MVYKAKKNIEGVLDILKHFVNYKEQLDDIKVQLNDKNLSDSNADIVNIFISLKKMQFVKNIELAGQSDHFKNKLKDIDQTYAKFEQKIIESFKEIPMNLARTNPAFVVKIVRILENE